MRGFYKIILKNSLLLSLVIYYLCFPQILFSKPVEVYDLDIIQERILFGEKEDTPFLIELKENLENKPVWDDESKQQYLQIVNILFEYNSRQGHREEEEILINQALSQFNKRENGENTQYLRRLLLTMTRFQKDINNADALLKYGNQAMQLYGEVNDYGYNYAILLNNMALGYYMQNDFLLAKLFIDEAIELYEKLMRNDNIPVEGGYYLLRNMRGLISLDIENFDDAIMDFEYIIEFAPETDISLQYAIQNLTSFYIRSQQYDKARPLVESISPLSTEQSIFRSEKLSLIDYFTNNSLNAIEDINSYNEKRKIETLNITKNFSIIGIEPYLKQYNQELVWINNLMAYKFPELTEEGFNANMFGRSLSLVLQNPTYKNSNLDSFLKEKIADYETIKNYLKLDESVVLFCEVPEMENFYEGSRYLGAYIFSYLDNCPQLVKLCKFREIEDLFYTSNPNIEDINTLYNGDISRNLYNHIWEPLLTHFPNSNKIYYSTCGVLNLINHEALIDDNGIRLGEQKELIYLTTPNEIIKEQRESTKFEIENIVLFADPDFNITIENTISDTNDKKENNKGNFDTYSNISAIRGVLMRDGWSPLPGSRKEVESISSLFNNNTEIKNYMGSSAVEDRVKELNGLSPKILHFATHGFVISNQVQFDDSSFAQSVINSSIRNTAMQWSGLLLAGGNHAWKGESIPQGMEDGILTAEEISRLDLSNTELVVLSACDTGRGHIDPVEGVWGLQRAFKEAGVKTILMTLWKVQDNTTAMFMTEFYRNLINGYSVKGAVKKAQQYLIDNGASDPYYWAPFVVLD